MLVFNPKIDCLDISLIIRLHLVIIGRDFFIRGVSFIRRILGPPQAAVEILKAKTIDPFVRGRICTILEAQQDKPFLKKTLIDQLNALLNTS